MNKFLLAVLGFTSISCMEINGMLPKTSREQANKSQTKHITSDIAHVMIKMRQDYETISSSPNPLMIDTIEYMLNSNLYHIKHRSTHTAQHILNASLLLTTKTLELVKALPKNIAPEIQYRILFFLARTGCHNYVYTPSTNNQTIPSSFIQYIASKIQSNETLKYFTDLHNSLLDKNNRIVIHNHNQIEILHKSQVPQGTSSNSPALIDKHDIKCAITFNIIYSLFGINNNVITELSKYNLLFFYDQLKNNILESTATTNLTHSTLQDISNNINRFIDFKKNFITFDINDQNAKLMTMVQTCLQNKFPPMIQAKLEPITQKNMSILLQNQRHVVVPQNLQTLMLPKPMNPQQITINPNAIMSFMNSMQKPIPVLKPEPVRVVRVANTPDIVQAQYSTTPLQPALCKTPPIVGKYNETDQKALTLFQDYPNIKITKNIRELNGLFRITPQTMQTLSFSFPYIYQQHNGSIVPTSIHHNSKQYLVNKFKTNDQEFLIAKSIDGKNAALFSLVIDDQLIEQAISNANPNVMSIPTYITLKGRNIQITPRPVNDSNIRGFIINTIEIDDVKYYITGK